MTLEKNVTSDVGDLKKELVIEQYCAICEDDMTWDYLGEQETKNGSFSLYNCRQCKGTRRRL